MEVTCASFQADEKMFVVSDILNKPQRGAAMDGIDSFNRLSDIFLRELVACDMIELIANLTSVSLIGLKEKAVDGST